MQDMIAAKFDPPMWMGDQITRDILLHRLDAVLTHRLTLVHTPAGYGKSILLSQWRDSQAAGVAQSPWRTPQRDARDLMRYVKHLLPSLRHEPQCSHAQTLSQSR